MYIQTHYILNKSICRNLSNRHGGCFTEDMNESIPLKSNMSAFLGSYKSISIYFDSHLKMKHVFVKIRGFGRIP